MASRPPVAPVLNCANRLLLVVVCLLEFASDRAVAECHDGFPVARRGATGGIEIRDRNAHVQFVGLFAVAQRRSAWSSASIGRRRHAEVLSGTQAQSFPNVKQHNNTQSERHGSRCESNQHTLEHSHPGTSTAHHRLRSTPNGNPHYERTSDTSDDGWHSCA